TYKPSPHITGKNCLFSSMCAKTRKVTKTNKINYMSNGIQWGAFFKYPMVWFFMASPLFFVVFDLGTTKTVVA
ncbi:hypothetical protein, partial [Vibrio parahaemolyticus]|uniref:hypothetical protein n=1 Tax=Vibrio parahaemolyticus TaxID=670 RepID=UPI00211574C3